MRYKVLNVNEHLYNIITGCECFLSIKCLPSDDYAKQYVEQYLDSICNKAETCIYGSSNHKYYDEFNKDNLYRTGLAFIKTVGTLNNRDKLIGLWPTRIDEDGTIEFTFDHLIRGTSNMRCEVKDCINNLNGYCGTDSYVTIQEDSTCDSILVPLGDKEDE